MRRPRKKRESWKYHRQISGRKRLRRSVVLDDISIGGLTGPLGSPVLKKEELGFLGRYKDFKRLHS